MISILNMSPAPTVTEEVQTSILANHTTLDKYIVLDTNSHIGYINKSEVTFKDGYEDITTDIVIRTTGANTPVFTQIGSTVFYAYKCVVNDYFFVNFHIPHSYKTGGNIYLHVHFMTDSDFVNSVKWEYSYTFAKGYGRSSFTPTNPSVAYSTTVPASAYNHTISETVAIDNTGVEIDGILMVRVRRVTNGATDNTGNCFVLFCDAHIEVDKVSTVNKNYPFT